MRDEWLNLNGTWNFAFDFGLSGDEKGWNVDPSELIGKIEVPFCPESRLSGVGHTDFIPCIWYTRTFRIPEHWSGKRIFLNFGAVDYDCRAWVNSTAVGRHYGTGSSFSFEITDALTDGENVLVVCARDDTRSGIQPRGKQSWQFYSQGCDYTRTTGIWQTVWLEAKPKAYIDSVRIVPDYDSNRFVVTPAFVNTGSSALLKIKVKASGNNVCSVSVPAVSGVPVFLDIPNPKHWSPSDPFLYDIIFELTDSDSQDVVQSYAGLRKFVIEGSRFLLNNKPVFLRLVLDQGFYPEGIWTAPSDDELRADIERSMAVGFNGARLHQKLFEERFHYWADKLGYLTWGEFPDWGIDFGQPQAIHNAQREWREIVMRDLNHPSIVAWTPFNETAGGASMHAEAHRRAVSETVALTKSLDPTRPVNDTSGYVHVETDIYTVHNYEQNPEKFAEAYAEVKPEARRGFCVVCPNMDIGYKGQPFVVDEYGGTWWEYKPDIETAGGDNKQSWGYGATPESIEEVYARISGLTAALTSHPYISGFCYTQLTDVEQERNGIYTYDRKLKFDMERLKSAFGAPAAVEE